MHPAPTISQVTPPVPSSLQVIEIENWHSPPVLASSQSVSQSWFALSQTVTPPICNTWPFQPSPQESVHVTVYVSAEAATQQSACVCVVSRSEHVVASSMPEPTMPQPTSEAND